MLATLVTSYASKGALLLSYYHGVAQHPISCADVMGLREIAEELCGGAEADAGNFAPDSDTHMARAHEPVI